MASSPSSISHWPLRCSTWSALPLPGGSRDSAPKSSACRPSPCSRSKSPRTIWHPTTSRGSFIRSAPWWVPALARPSCPATRPRCWGAFRQTMCSTADATPRPANQGCCLFPCPLVRSRPSSSCEMPFWLFASFVLLVEGDSERIVLPRLAEALGVLVDPSFVAIVPLGGRHVNHFWRLLKGLGIPYATLLDLDMGRDGGEYGRVKNALQQLLTLGVPREKILELSDGTYVNVTDEN